MSIKLVQLCAVWLALLATAQTSSKSVTECYQCNSATVGEEKCDSTVDEKWKKKCQNARTSGKKVNDSLSMFDKAVGCRKIVQQIGEDERTIRECAYSGGDVNGHKRTGNKNVKVSYYQCSEDACNSSTAVVGCVATVLLTCVAALLR